MPIKPLNRRQPLGLLLLSALFFAAATGRAAAQQPADDGWDVAIYPIFGWLPVSIELDVNLPPLDLPGAGGGGIDAEILDKRFDGAYFGGFSAAKGRWYLQGNALYAAVGGDRSIPPVFTVDSDVSYFYLSAGFEVAPNLYLTAGVRRMALKYVIEADELGIFERKPGIWDPLVGLAYHARGDRFDLHLTAEGGGFGVGADVDLAAAARIDWRLFEHFGLTAGYQLLHFKVENTRLNRTLTVKQTMHGPMVGVGLYF